VPTAPPLVEAVGVLEEKAGKGREVPKSRRAEAGAAKTRPERLPGAAAAAAAAG